MQIMEQRLSIQRLFLMVRNLERVFSERLAMNVGVQQPLMTWGCADLWVKITITVAF